MKCFAASKKENSHDKFYLSMQTYPKMDINRNGIRLLCFLNYYLTACIVRNLTRGFLSRVDPLDQGIWGQSFLVGPRIKVVFQKMKHFIN